MSQRPTRVAIVGAGPAGATSAILLARKGASVALFDDGRRPDLVVGESLVPLLTVLFRKLGIEDAVRALGVRKPGVTFAFGENTNFPLSFEAVRGLLPTYAYNVPRREFDALLLQTARRAGARCIPIAAHLVGDPSRDEVRLAPETLDAVPEWHGEAPDVIIDASGRRRTLSRLLQIPASVGPRKDVAHFAHYEGCAWPAPAGQVEIARLERGWSWRIPLPGPRLSIGVVIPREHAQRFGASGEEQLEEIIANDRHLAAVTASRRRVTRVATYANYQLISERGSGKGWAMVGDAFGFVDPMLSPGLSMAMVSAERLAAAIPAHGVRRPGMEAALAGYGRWFRDQLEAWQNLVSYFYDGRIFAIHRTGADIAKVLPRLVSRTMERHVARNLAGMASGALTARPYPRWLLQLLGRHTAHKHDPAQFAIA